jgi:hypothetical protein
MAAIMSRKAVGANAAVRASRPAFSVGPKFAQRRSVLARAEPSANGGRRCLCPRSARAAAAGPRPRTLPRALG